jgi:4-amino-4-deoxy-L-arabinose transferase-like glycosyltransferase
MDDALYRANDNYGIRLWLLIGILSIVMLATSGLWGVVETSEARYAEISREMLRSNDWMHPTLLNIHHYHKPPVTYWITATAFSIFGVNPFATRFFLTIAFTIQILLVYLITREMLHNKRVAWYAALIYATLPIVMISVRGLTTDAYVNTFVLLGVYAWILYCKRGNRRYAFGFALAMGFGFMTKGPAVIVIPACVVLSLWTYVRPQRLSPATIGVSLILFIVSGFTWFAYVIYEDPQLADYFFFHHIVDRVSHAEVFSRREPWYYYLPIVPLITLPWIVSFVEALKKGQMHRQDSLVRRVMIGWVVAPFIIYSIASSKLVLYILPLFAGFAIVTATLFEKPVTRKTMLWLYGIIALLYILILITPAVLRDVDGMRWLSVLPFSFLVLSTVVAFVLPTTDRAVATLALLFAIHVNVYAAFLFRSNSLLVNSITPITRFIEQHDLDKRNIIVVNTMLPALSFELDKDIVSVYAGEESSKRETQFEPNRQFKSTFVDATTREDTDRLALMLDEPSVVIMRAKGSAQQQALLPGVWKQKRFGKWIVYYN